MTGSGETRRLELWVTYVRWFGVAFGVLAVAIQPRYPSSGTQVLAWILLALLGLGNLTIWGTVARVHHERALERLGAASFIFDALIVMGFVWVFAYENPYVSWALLFLLPMEGALRYRLAGALSAALAVAVFFIAQSVRVADLHDSSFDVATYVFVVGMSGLVAGISGTMSENWHQQHGAFVEQGLALAELDRLKDRFLAVTSHEIRGPLTAIIAGIDTVNKRGDRLAPEQRTRLLEMVSTQGRQLARLVDDLLLTSELQVHKLTLHPEWNDLSDTVDQAVQAAGGKRRAHQLELFVDPIRCVIDRSRTVQIVRNLVENAYKYTPERTRVAVESMAAGDGIDIVVADEGPGIPPDRRDQLFEAFSRIRETSAGQDGVGLGLYVVGQLVAAMGGQIDLTSSSKGTTFTIHLPCKTAAAEEARLGLVGGPEEGIAG
jgi:signal transduction histidine kinase